MGREMALECEAIETPALRSLDEAQHAEFHERGYIQQLADEFAPEAILGVNTHPSSRAVLIDTDRPIWCDLNGWIMAEAQA